MRVLFLIAVAAVCCGGALAQAPPIKMGLWEKTMTNNGAGSPTTMKSKSCITPAEWQEMVGNATKQHEGCKIQTTKTAKGYTYDGTCTIGETSLLMKGSTTITDAEHIVSESHSTSTRNGQKQQIDMQSTSHWVGANCGKVEPGEPEIEE